MKDRDDFLIEVKTSPDPLPIAELFGPLSRLLIDLREKSKSKSESK